MAISPVRIQSSRVLALSIFVLLIWGAAADRAEAYFEGNHRYDGHHLMNGIDFKKYRSFPERWKFVTVRYREDSGEMRMTYANDRAYKHLQGLTKSKTKTPYPDGANFGKVALVTEKDPRFTSSKVPSKSKRYLLMVKDAKKYKDTGGWGYALFDGNGVTFNEDPQTKTMSCYSCHLIVKGDDYVFSEEMVFQVGREPSKSSKLNLEWHSAKFDAFTPALPKEVQTFVRTNAAKFVSGGGLVDRLDPSLLKNFFSGTLDEIVPTLLERSREVARPVLYVGDGANFSLVVPEGVSESAKGCHKIVIVFRGKTVRDDRVCR
ncbi:MAG: cytochrome P460 family protein [Bdellovibrionales bacterium]|jgi:hypothetical protein|nr:cytochrome P460 family protein [Bdellovibrionales bacterium]